MFTQEQIAISLRATQLVESVLCATVIMDQELNSDILSALPDDPLYIAHQKEPQPCWTVTNDCYASTWRTYQILFLLLLLYLNHDSFVRWLTYAADTVMTPSTYDSSH